MDRTGNRIVAGSRGCCATAFRRTPCPYRNAVGCSDRSRLLRCDCAIRRDRTHRSSRGYYPRHLPSPGAWWTGAHGYARRRKSQRCYHEIEMAASVSGTCHYLQPRRPCSPLNAVRPGDRTRRIRLETRQFEYVGSSCHDPPSCSIWWNCSIARHGHARLSTNGDDPFQYRGVLYHRKKTGVIGSAGTPRSSKKILDTLSACESSPVAIAIAHSSP